MAVHKSTILHGGCDYGADNDHGRTVGENRGLL